MRLKRLAVRNFRNLRDIDVPLGPGTVIVGENRSGKSNLLHAVRLVLDPSLPNADRFLTPEDFSEELADDDRDPMTEGDVIEVIVELTDFEDDALPLTAISEALVEDDPSTARLTYRFAPRGLGGPTCRSGCRRAANSLGCTIVMYLARTPLGCSAVRCRRPLRTPGPGCGQRAHLHPRPIGPGPWALGEDQEACLLASA